MICPRLLKAHHLKPDASNHLIPPRPRIGNLRDNNYKVLWVGSYWPPYSFWYIVMVFILCNTYISIIFKSKLPPLLANINWNLSHRERERENNLVLWLTALLEFVCVFWYILRVPSTFLFVNCRQHQIDSFIFTATTTPHTHTFKESLKYVTATKQLFMRS